MEANTGTDIVEPLIRLQEIDRARDRLQRRLDEVPVKLKSYTDAIAAFEREIDEEARNMNLARAEADRTELDVKTREERREKIKQAMNAPKLTNREYETLQEELAGVLADINSLSDTALKALERASESEDKVANLRSQIASQQSEYETKKAQLEGGLSDVKADLDRRTGEREKYIDAVDFEALRTYERVRRKHKDALAIVDGTIDRAAGRMGNDLHCSACYIGVTANDALNVLARKRVVQCKSCVRILYVP